MFNREFICALCLPLTFCSASLSMAGDDIDRRVIEGRVIEGRVITIEVEGAGDGDGKPLFQVAPVAPGVPGGGIQFAPGDRGAAPGTLVVTGSASAVPAGKVEMKKVAYLGVSTSPVSPPLASHLKLPAGFGLVVDHAEEGGPAFKAGLKAHDVLIRLGDQRLVNAMQLGTLIRARKPGDEVEFAVLREGGEVTVKATLIEKEMPVAEVFFPPHELFIDGQAGDQPRMKWLHRAVPMEGWERKAMQGSMRFADEEHQLEISHDKEGRSLIVKDKAGKEIFSGPINTPEERKAVPQAVQPKLEKLEKSSRLRIRQLTPGLPPGAVPGGEFDIELIAPFNAEQIKKLIEDQLKGIELNDNQARDLQQRIEEMKKQVDEAMRKIRVQQEEIRARIQQGELPGPGPGPGQNEIQRHEVRQSQAVAKMNDGTHEITLTSNQNGRHLTVKDQAGRELFNGPINTDQEQTAIPQDLRGKLEQLEKSVKLDVFGDQKP